MPDWDVEIPVLAEQKTIAGVLDALHEKIINSDRESQRFATVRDEFLPLLMSGKIRV